MTSPPVPRPDKVREQDVQRSVVAMLRAGGWTVNIIGDRRRGYTRVTEGTPDLWIMHPVHGGGWFEVKSPTGQLRETQLRFAADCARCGIRWVCGGEETARRLLYHGAWDGATARAG